MYNPRFPHKFRVFRPKVDTNGEPVLDVDGNPTYILLPLDKVINDDGTPFITEVVESMPFGYRTQGRNMSESRDVYVADYKLASPRFLTILNVGDRLEITDFDRTFFGEVVKKITNNLGSNIWINEVKN